MLFCCPVCGESLTREGGSLYCPARHCFDSAKSGYVNLLTADRMHSKTPGDDKRMVNARRAFLDGGWYAYLRRAFCVTVLDYALGRGERPLSLLDAGCGEGYYTAAVAETLAREGISADVNGVDISKTAIHLAAKRTADVAFAVASVFHLPVAGESVDILTELFAPFCLEEFHRVLKKDGILLLVIPADRHLLELKQAVYEHPYRNEVKPYGLEGFAFLGGMEIESDLRLERKEDIQNLFAMTPYAYKTSRADMERLNALDRLDATAVFELLEYRKL